MSVGAFSPWKMRALALLVGVLIVLGCWRTSHLNERDHLWAVVVTIVAALGLNEIVPFTWRLLAKPGVLSIVIATSAAAVFFCVPETSEQMGDIGLVIAVGCGVEWYRRRQLPVWWHLITVALVLWGGVYGAYGRQSALVGAFFAQWPVVIVPVVAALLPTLRRAPEPVRWLVAAFGAAAAIVVARTGALHYTVKPAIIAVIVCGTVSLFAAIAITVLEARRNAASRTASV